MVLDSGIGSLFSDLGSLFGFGVKQWLEDRRQVTNGC